MINVYSLENDAVVCNFQLYNTTNIINKHMTLYFEERLWTVWHGNQLVELSQSIVFCKIYTINMRLMFLYYDNSSKYKKQLRQKMHEVQVELNQSVHLSSLNLHILIECLYFWWLYIVKWRTSSIFFTHFGL